MHWSYAMVRFIGFMHWLYAMVRYIYIYIYIYIYMHWSYAFVICIGHIYALVIGIGHTCIDHMHPSYAMVIGALIQRLYIKETVHSALNM